MKYTSVQKGTTATTPEKKLRSSVLDSVQLEEDSEIAATLWSGDIYRHPIEYNMYDLPVQHEMGGIFRNKTDADLQDMISYLSRSLSNVMDDSDKQVYISKTTDVPPVMKTTSRRIVCI